MKLLVIPNEPVEEYERYGQTYAMYPHRYFNPRNMFSEVVFLYPGVNKKDEVRKGAFYARVPNKLLDPRTPGALLRRGVALAKERNIDLIRAFNPHLEGYSAVRIGRKTGIPSVVSYHNPYNMERKVAAWSLKRSLLAFPVQRFCEWYCNRHATRIFCVSTQLKKDLIAKGVDANKIDVIYNKVELAKYRKHDKKKEAALIKRFKLGKKDVVLFIGRFVEQKNIFTLLEAFALVAQDVPKAHLVMVSDGPQRAQVEAWISAHNLGSRITLTGFQKNDDLPHFLHLAKTFVLPSWYEGFGIVLIEAQAAGCPVICSDIPHVRDIVNQKNALLFDPHSTTELATCIRTMLEDSSVRTLLAKNASKSVERFGWTVREREDAKLYEALRGRS